MKKLEIKQSDIIYNLKSIKESLERNTRIIAVVKANGMGLDLVKYASLLVKAGVRTLAVANVIEAVKLRKAGIETEIIMLSETVDLLEAAILIDNDITISIGSLEEKELLTKLSRQAEKRVKVHVAVDTGFSRYGFMPNDLDLFTAVKSTKEIEVAGCFTHFSNAIDEKSTFNQFEKFSSLIPAIKEINPKIKFHCANSQAALLYPETHLDYVRIGSAIQGRVLDDTIGLRKIGKFKTEIVKIKNILKGETISYTNAYKAKEDMKIAIIPVGYMDGFNRKKGRDDFSFKDNLKSVGMEIKKLFNPKKYYLKVKIREEEYNVVGRLGMYHSVIDITGNDFIQIGEEVEIDISPIYVDEFVRREYI